MVYSEPIINFGRAVSVIRLCLGLRSITLHCGAAPVVVQVRDIGGTGCSPAGDVSLRYIMTD